MRAQMAVPLTVVLSLGLSVGCDGTPKPVSYGADIKPLIDQYCMECHAKGRRRCESQRVCGGQL